jgi:hypothetical protein
MALFSKYCEQNAPINVRFLLRIHRITPGVLLRHVVHLVNAINNSTKPVSPIFSLLTPGSDAAAPCEEKMATDGFEGCG